MRLAAALGLTALTLSVMVSIDIGMQSAMASEIHVNPAAEPGGDGSSGNPFASLALASERLKPGDVCILHVGVYRETLRPARSGTAEQPIVYRAAGDGEVTLTGCEPVNDLTDEGGRVWSAEVDMAAPWQQQVFVDGKMLWLARWPNAPQGAWFEFPKATLDKGSQRSTIVDADLPDVDLTGARVWASSHRRWYSWTAAIQKHEAKKLQIADTTDAKGNHVPAEGGVYVVMGAEALFDAPWEWFHDSQKLRIRLPENYQGEPRVEIKRRQEVIDLRGRSHIFVEGITTRAGAIVTDQVSTGCRLDRLRVFFVSHDLLAEDQYDSQKAATGVVFAGRDHHLTNSEIAYSSGNGVLVTGERMRVVNCHIHDTNYAGTYASAIELSLRPNPSGPGEIPSRHTLISHCTLERCGRSLIGTHGFYDSLIQFCDLRYAGLLTWDLGMTYGNTIAGGGSEFRFNHLRHNLAAERNMGLYHDHGCKNILNHHNVVWGTNHAALKNNQYAMYLFWYKNTAICEGRERGHAYGSTWAAAQPRQLWGCELRGNYLQGEIHVKANKGELLIADNFQARKIPLDQQGVPAPSGRLMDEPIEGLIGPVQTASIGARHADEPWTVGHDFENPPKHVETRRSKVPNRNRLRDACFEGGEAAAWIWTGGAELQHVEGAGSQWVIDAASRMGRFSAKLPRPGATVAQTVSDLPPGRAWTAIAHCDVRTGSVATLSLLDENGEVLASAECRPRKRLKKGEHGFQPVVIHSVVPGPQVTLMVSHTGRKGIVNVDDLGLARKRTD